MAKEKAPKAGRERAPKVKKAKVKGAFLDRVTNLVAALFALSLVAERVVGG